MVIITNSIEIACPPELVRQTVINFFPLTSTDAKPTNTSTQFLAFPTLPTYHSSFFISITPQGPLEPNQHITVIFAEMGKMDAVVNVRVHSDLHSQDISL
jgi:hypothetical protein